MFTVTMKVNVETYNPKWADDFQLIKKELETILRGTRYVSIEHVGSTSVPGLAAKPIIDISIIVDDEEQIQDVKRALTNNSILSYIDYGERGIKGRNAFSTTALQGPARNVYACINGCLALRNHLLVRDVCRADTTIRDAYGEYKLALAKRDWIDIDAYAEAKSDILSQILEKGLDRDELEEIKKANIRKPIA